MLTYKALHGLAPHYLSELLTPYSPARDLRSSEAGLLIVPLTRLKSMGDGAFSSIAPKLWNSLPAEIRQAESLKLCPKPLPIHYIVHYIGCQPFCSGVRILSERHHSLHSFTTFTHNPLWIRVYIRCTLAEALFPRIQCVEDWARMKVRERASLNQKLL